MGAHGRAWALMGVHASGSLPTRAVAEEIVLESGGVAAATIYRAESSCVKSAASGCLTGVTRLGMGRQPSTFFVSTLRTLSARSRDHGVFFQRPVSHICCNCNQRRCLGWTGVFCGSKVSQQGRAGCRMRWGASGNRK
eukprot:199809-Chlamydomonas_euryale.AAC.2